MVCSGMEQAGAVRLFPVAAAVGLSSLAIQPMFVMGRKRDWLCTILQAF